MTCHTTSESAIDRPKRRDCGDASLRKHHAGPQVESQRTNSLFMTLSDLVRLDVLLKVRASPRCAAVLTWRRVSGSWRLCRPAASRGTLALSQTEGSPARGRGSGVHETEEKQNINNTFFPRQEERVTVLLTGIRTVGGSQMHQPLSRKRRADCCCLFTPTVWSGQSFPGSSFKGYSINSLICQFLIGLDSFSSSYWPCWGVLTRSSGSPEHLGWTSRCSFCRSTDKTPAETRTAVQSFLFLFEILMFLWQNK